MTGPEAGTTFRNPTGLNPGYNAFQTVSDACKPNCAPSDWDYLSILYLRGTHVQHNQWSDEIGTITQGALVEYTTASGEVARTYTTTTDNQGSYTFAGLAPGVYTLQRTVNGNINTERIVIRQAQVDITVNLRASAFTPTPTRTMAPLKQITSPTMTPTPGR